MRKAWSSFSTVTWERQTFSSCKLLETKLSMSEMLDGIALCQLEKAVLILSLYLFTYFRVLTIIFFLLFSNTLKIHDEGSERWYFMEGNRVLLKFSPPSLLASLPSFPPPLSFFLLSLLSLPSPSSIPPPSFSNFSFFSHWDVYS